MTDEQRNAHYLLSTHGDPWAIEPSRMRAYLNTLIVSDMDQEESEARTGPLWTYFYDCNGEVLIRSTADEVNAIKGEVKDALAARKTRRAIAVLPLTGPITQRAGLFTAFFGGTSTEKWGRAFDELVASSAVGAIVVDADTPGGTVSGVPELADKLFKARAAKPVVVVSNAILGSAGYWIGSSAGELVLTPSGEVGSIGVWSMHVNYSGMMEKEGVDVTLISAGKYKTEMSPYEPLSEEAKAYEQGEVNRYYGMFIDAVARGRGVTAATVRNGFGQGRMVGPKDAKAEGMVDRVATLEDTIRRLGGGVAEREQARAEHEERETWLKEQRKELGFDDAH
jgi:signal peptide peptidase SppA